MKRQQARVERAAQALLAQRLAETTEPLARARLQEALGVPLARWADAELRALRAALQRESAAAPTAAPPAPNLQLPDLAGLSDAELRALKRRMERGLP